MKKLQVYSLAALLAAGCSAVSASTTFNLADLHAEKHKLAELFTTAEEQKERASALLKDPKVDVKKINFDEVSATISTLEKEYQKLEKMGPHVPVREELDDRYMPLIIEMVRQLKNVRREYRERLDIVYATAKKLALPVGVGISVFGGLMIANILGATNTTFTSALLSGILAGGVVGFIVYKDDVLRGMGSAVGKLGDLVGIPLDGRTIKTTLKISGAVAVTALTGAVLYIKRDALKRLVGKRS